MPAGAKHVGDGGDLLEAEVPIQARSLKAIRVEEDYPGTALLRLGFDAGEEGACDAATAEALLHEQVLDLHGIRHKVRHDTARELALDPRGERERRRVLWPVSRVVCTEEGVDALLFQLRCGCYVERNCAMPP